MARLSIKGGPSTAEIEAALPPSVESSSTITAEPVVYVSKSGSDSNSGLGPAQAFATIKKAIEHLEALTGHTGVIEIGAGTWTEPRLTRPSGCLVRGKGHALTHLKLANGDNGNVFQDAAWGSKTTIGDGGGYEKLNINGNKANQTLKAAQALLTHLVTISAAPTTINVDDASAFNAAGVTEGTLWVGGTRCAYTALTYTGTPFSPTEPTTTGWKFEGVTTTSGSSVTYYPEALILPGAAWGHGIAIQSSRTTMRDVLIEGCMGSGRAYQGAGGTGPLNYENKSFNVRAQQCNRYDLEINPSASDGMSFGDVGGNAAMGSLLVMSPDWEFHNWHPSGVSPPNSYNARNAPYAAIVCAEMTRWYGCHLDSFPYGQICINLAWMQQNVRQIYIKGDIQNRRGSLASAGAGNGIDFYGQEDIATLTANDIDIDFGMNARLLFPLSLLPITETVLVPGTEYHTPSSGGEANKLQVISALPFSPLGSAIAGTLHLVAELGTVLDDISYTGKSSATAWVAAEAAIGATELQVDDASKLAASGVVTIYPQATAETAVTPLIVSYTSIEGNTLKGIPHEGNGSITEALPAGTGVAQHYITGVKSTGAGNVSITPFSNVTQAGGTTGRRLGSVSGSLRSDYSSLRRPGTPIRGGTNNTRIRVSGRIINKPNPFFGSVSVGVGNTTASVAHGLGGTPAAGCYGASPTADPQQRWKVTVSSTEITVTLSAAASGTAVTFNVWAQNTPN